MKCRHICILAMSLLWLTACEQSPTTLDEEPYLPDAAATTFSMEISRFEFDYLSQEFFFSVGITSPNQIDEVAFNLYTNASQIGLLLNDLGQDNDILTGDGRYDGGWTLPDSMSTYVDSLWTLEVIVHDNQANTLTKSVTLLPEIPAAPLIGLASHRDTLSLLSDDLVLDTLTLEVSHPNGLDEIRDVSMMSLKPDGTYANGGQPIPLYDDGGREVFYSFGGIDFTSGDTLANDGIYSLLLALAPNNLSGVYNWTFHSRTWLGIEAETVMDSIVVLPPANLSRRSHGETERKGVFQ